MNQIYRLVFNRHTGVCQAVCELAKGTRGANSGAGGASVGGLRKSSVAAACLIAFGALAGGSVWAQDTYGPITGMQGADGAFNAGTGTDGSAGSVAVQSTSVGTNYGAVTGGSGGAGGAGIAAGGSGGSGGAGLTSDSLVSNVGTIAGGAGGAGGGGIAGGAGGAGGAGIVLTAPVVLLNSGVIEGGAGGSPGSGAGPTPAAAAGGVAVIAGNRASVENRGTLRGGLSGDGLARADALRFTGEGNWLGLFPTSVIEGNVVGSVTGDTLGLAGSTDAVFDIGQVAPGGQYRNFTGLQKLGTNTWTLTGAASGFTAWTIFSGTLAIASDASLGEQAGALTLNGGTLRTTANVTSGRSTVLAAGNGTLQTDTGTTYTVNGVVSGSGLLTKTGNGTTALTATNTYSGGTVISAGTLTGSAGSFGSGAIVNNAALVIGQAQDARLNNTLSGTGSLTKTGAGALELAGNSSAFGGNTLVSAGTLAVNGSLGGALTIGNGATLVGTGTVGNTVVQSGARLAPGNSIGTLNVAGNITLAPGSVYQLEASADGTSDQLRASGVATLQGGDLSVLASGNFAPATSYSIITADGGVSGRFGAASTNMAFLEPVLTYEPRNVILRLQRNTAVFQSVAQTPNQFAVAQSVGMMNAAPVYGAIAQLSAADARAAFDSLSGELHASLRSAAFDDSRFVRDASLARLSGAFNTAGATTTGPAGSRGSQGGAWGQAFYSGGKTDGDFNLSATDRSTRGIFLGADSRFGDGWRLGVLGGYSRSRVTLDSRASDATGHSYHAGVYGGKEWGRIALRAGASYSAGDVDTSRNIAFPGFSGTASANYDTRTSQVFGELGWKLPMARGSLEPFAGLAHINLRTDGFTESGGAGALSVGKRSDSMDFSTIGVRASRSFGAAGTPSSLRGLIGWRHAFGSLSPNGSAALAGQPGFAVTGAPIERNVLAIEGGIDFMVRPNLTLGVSYMGQVGKDMADHGVKVGLLWKFR